MPDNLFSSIIEEQSLFQGLISSPFRHIFPIFKTDKTFDSVKIYPPVAIKGYIVRTCNIDISCGMQSNRKVEGFVLGYAGEEAESLIEAIPRLKKQARQTKFDIISSKRWYIADVQYKKMKGNLVWSIENIKWYKQKYK